MKTKITMVRGDTRAFKVPFLYSDGSQVQDKDIESIRLTCRKSTNALSPALFEKETKDFKVSDSYLYCQFNPTDTESLDYGQFYFDIEVTLKNGYRKTMLYKLKLTEETTIHSGGVNE